MASTRDDSFHEIQLNGKQLVFLFMVVIVVSSVIFLCGVLVGRGVRTGRTELAEARAIEDASRGEIGAAARSVPAAPLESDPRAAAPPPAVSDLSYFDRLERSSSQPESVKADDGPAPDRRLAAREKEAKEKEAKEAKDKELRPAEATAKPAATEPKAASAAPPPPPAAPGPAPAPPVPAAKAATPLASGSAFVVQVAAMNVRSDAEARAKRLAAKGYSAYVEAPTPASPNVYRVRIGPFKSQVDAQSTADRLKKEENVRQPWVTR